MKSDTSQTAIAVPASLSAELSAHVARWRVVSGDAKGKRSDLRLSLASMLIAFGGDVKGGPGKSAPSVLIGANRAYGAAMDIAKRTTLQDVSGPDRPLCIVWNCGQPAQHLWISATWQGWPAEWMVCVHHYAQLIADQEWQRAHGLGALLEVVAPTHEYLGERPSQIDGQPPGLDNLPR